MRAFNLLEHRCQNITKRIGQNSKALCGNKYRKEPPNELRKCNPRHHVAFEGKPTKIG